MAGGRALAAVVAMALVCAAMAGTAEVHIPLGVFADRLVMSRCDSTIENPITRDVNYVMLHNTGSTPVKVLSITLSSPFALNRSFHYPVTIAAGSSLRIAVKFSGTTPSNVNYYTYTSNMSIHTDASNGAVKTVTLVGVTQQRAEGNKEPQLATLIAAQGFKTVIVGEGQEIENKGRLELVGDEVAARFFQRASGAPVTVRQLSAYHTCCNNPASFYWYPATSTSTTGTRVTTMDGRYAQTVFPPPTGKTTLLRGSFSPPGKFAVRIDSESSDNLKNKVGGDDCSQGRATCGKHVRTWPAKDEHGAVIPNTYLITMDYNGVNFDFNDNTYLVTNIRPLAN